MIVGRYIKEDNPTIYMVANVTKYAVYDVTIGLISIDIKTNKREFMVNLSATQDNHNKTKVEINFLAQAIDYFCSRAALLCADEIKNDNARELFEIAKGLLKKTTVIKERQISIEPVGQDKPQNAGPSIDDIDEDEDEDDDDDDDDDEDQFL